MSTFNKRFHFKVIDSTSAFLLRRRFDLKNFTFVYADYQTNGHGRMGREWMSPKSQNLMCSILIKDDSLIHKYQALSVCSAIAIAKLLESLGLSEVTIKWPNDVYVKGNKICGILLESIADDGELNSLVVGIGLNVNQKDFTGNYYHEPTSIVKELNKKQCLMFLKIQFEKYIKKNYQELLHNEKSILEYYETHDYLKEKAVLANIAGENKEVIVLGINPDYSLRVQSNEEILNLNSGEISFHI